MDNSCIANAKRALQVSLLEFLVVLVPGVLVPGVLAPGVLAPAVVGRCTADTCLYDYGLGALSGFCGCWGWGPVRWDEDILFKRGRHGETGRTAFLAKILQNRLS